MGPREVEWAKEQAQRNQDFRFIVLKLADINIPDPIAAAGPVIDCRGLWKSNGINEELYAALFRRGGRRAWLEHQRELPENGPENDEGFSYADFESDSGTVIDFHYKLCPQGRFRFWKRQKTLVWHLTYESDGETKNVSGVGEDKPIDLSIKAGDHIGSFVCRRRFTKLLRTSRFCPHAYRIAVRESRHNILYLRGEQSRPCWTNVTHQVYPPWHSRIEGPLLCAVRPWMLVKRMFAKQGRVHSPPQ
jgi:hypothetical protein